MKNNLYKKFNLILLITFINILFSGCARYSSPSSLIKHPKIPDVQIETETVNDAKDSTKFETNNYDDMKSIVYNFMPYDAEILSSDKIVTKKALYNMDLDGDSIDEIVVFYEKKKDSKIRILVLKKSNDKWDIKFGDDIEGKYISFFKTVKAYNKEQVSLIIGSLISDSVGSNYVMISLGNENDVVYYNDIGIWKKFDILSDFSHEDNNGFVFGTWCRENSQFYKVNVIGYNPNKIKYYPVDDLYTDYFKDAIDYYDEIIAEDYMQKDAWYYLIDSQIKADKAEDALKSIGKALKIKNDENTVTEIEDYEFYLLKAKALNKLKRFNEAEEILIDVSRILNEKNDKSLELADAYFELGKTYLNRNNKVSAKEALEESHDVIKELSKDPFYKENPTARIKKLIIYYPVMDDLYKLSNNNN